MDEKFLENIKNVDGLIIALQYQREKYGNLPVCIDLSSGKAEGCYYIDAVLYGTDEAGGEFIDLISW